MGTKPKMGKLERPLPKPGSGNAEVEGDDGNDEHSDVAMESDGENK